MFHVSFAPDHLLGIVPGRPGLLALPILDHFFKSCDLLPSACHTRERAGVEGGQPGGRFYLFEDLVVALCIVH